MSSRMNTGWEVTGPLDVEMQVAIACNARSETTINAIEFRNQAQQSQEVTFVQRHEPDKGPGLCDRLRNDV